MRSSSRKDLSTDTGDRAKGKHRFPLAQIIIVIGLLMCLAPVVSNLWAIHKEAENVSSLSSTIATVDPGTKAYLLAQAQAYNARLGGYGYEDVEDIIPYDEQLATDNTGAIGWLEVPKAAIKMVVYHGVDDSVLSTGVGHQPETSLPIGGARSHCFLSGHSGLQRQRVFDGIRALEPGDVFAIHVMGDVYAYRVTGWEIVDAAQVDLAVVDGDYCTLVTCTTEPDQWNPKGRIGINDKRLLVTGERCEYDPAEFENTAIDPSVYVNDNTRPALIALLVLVVGAVVFLVMRKMRKRSRVEKGKETLS